MEMGGITHYTYVRCQHCSTTFLTTDDSFRCGRCRRKGHTYPYEKCLICAGKEPEGKDPLANIDTLINMMPKRYG